MNLTNPKGSQFMRRTDRKGGKEKYCAVCDIWLNGPAQWEYHLQEDKHKKAFRSPGRTRRGKVSASYRTEIAASLVLFLCLFYGARSSTTISSAWAVRCIGATDAIMSDSTRRRLRLH